MARFDTPGYTCDTGSVKTVTIRDVRHRWPETEKALEREGEILITRDARPVAKLVRVDATAESRARFDPVAHEAWQRRVGGGRPVRWVDETLSGQRADRSPTENPKEPPARKPAPGVAHDKATKATKRTKSTRKR